MVIDRLTQFSSMIYLSIVGAMIILRKSLFIKISNDLNDMYSRTVEHYHLIKSRDHKSESRDYAIRLMNRDSSAKLRQNLQIPKNTITNEVINSALSTRPTATKAQEIKEPFLQPRAENDNFTNLHSRDSLSVLHSSKLLYENAKPLNLLKEGNKVLNKLSMGESTLSIENRLEGVQKPSNRILIKYVQSTSLKKLQLL